MTPEHTRHREAGFTLIEAVIALALMGLILGALATITAQWLPNWNRGIARVQKHERVALGLERISSDLAAAEFISIGRDARGVFFDGTDRSVTLVRTAIGPNSETGLEVVRFAETITDVGPHLVRTRAPFVPGIPAIRFSNEAKFTDPVVLLRAYRVAFSYAGNRSDMARWLAAAIAVAESHQGDVTRCRSSKNRSYFDGYACSCRAAHGLRYRNVLGSMPRTGRSR